MPYRPSYKMHNYKGFYYRENHTKGYWEVGKYHNGKWQLWWTNDTEDEVLNDIDREVEKEEEE